MSLPKLAVPRFSVQLPSNGTTVNFRPFLVAEEKILLMAVEAGDPASQIEAIKDVISSCADGVNVSKLPYFDLEYLFLHLRAKSVGEDIKFTYRHRDGVNREGHKCDHATEVCVNIEDIKIEKKTHKTKFMIDETYGLKMKYPTIDDVSRMVKNGNDELTLMASCIESVYDADNVYPADNLDETIKFIKSMNSKQYRKLNEWFESMPSLKHEVTYQCGACGQIDKVVFEGVSDFF